MCSSIRGVDIVRLRSMVIGAATVALALCVAAPASAVVTETAGGKRVSYLPVNGEAPHAPSPFAANGNLDYAGGPVMPAMHQHVIFWAPSGFSYPAGYQAAAVKYMQDLAADSGKATNTTSVGAQYTDGTAARANYNVTFDGSFNDSTAYPASGCPAPYTTLSGVNLSICLTDQQLRNEVNAFITAHSLPRGTSNIYFLFLPDTVGNCFTSAGTSCFDKQYCAYHSHTTASGTDTIYANESFTPRDPSHCGNGNYPNGHANGNIDDQLSSLSHEANEAREDPDLNAWFNQNTGDEGADQCRNTADDYGPLLGGTLGVDGINQIINGAHYILQQDWSNAHNGCEQRYALSGVASGPTSGRAGQPLTFTATGTDAEGGSVTGVTINFGDGTSAGAGTTSHAYSAPGTYQVSETITSSVGLRATVAGPTVTIVAPPNNFSFGKVKLNKKKGTAKLPVTVPVAGTLTLAGKGLKPIHKAKVRPKAVAAGTTKLKVKAKGKAARKLKKTGKLKVRAKVTFRPNGGLSKTRSKKIKLRHA